ncbi:hypothetical protein DMN91_005793 [Ooceraea biroi]|uniref:Uncharacterized protein n=1 Tax=Ooceraea biroi TaxID=2015173 RepID=A0A3L8DLW2_OOCBI|nr:hypothetical protein DMN91_005793 [Ooceraea biroi]
MFLSYYCACVKFVCRVTKFHGLMSQVGQVRRSMAKCEDLYVGLHDLVIVKPFVRDKWKERRKYKGIEISWSDHVFTRIYEYGSLFTWIYAIVDYSDTNADNNCDSKIDTISRNSRMQEVRIVTYIYNSGRSIDNLVLVQITRFIV